MTAAQDAGAPDVCIVNYQGASDTLAALASLNLAQCGTVFVVDNSVDAEQARQLQLGTASMKQVKLLVAPENLGFGRGCNWAFEQSTSAEFLLLNPDAQLRPGALQRLRATLNEDPQRAAVAPRLDWTSDGHVVLPNLVSQAPAARLWQALMTRFGAQFPAAYRQRGARLARRCARDMNAQNPLPANALSGAVVLLRRHAVLAAGGLFDPAFFMFYEDTDLSQRLTSAGFTLAIEPRAHAWHAWRHRASKAALMAASEPLYMLRHHARSHRWMQPWVARCFVDPWQADTAPVPSVSSFDQARQLLGRFFAITPLPMLHPAGVRPDGVARQLSLEEWHLLEPGRWYAWVDAGQPHEWRRLWRRFDVVSHV